MRRLTSCRAGFARPAFDARGRFLRFHELSQATTKHIRGPGNRRIFTVGTIAIFHYRFQKPRVLKTDSAITEVQCWAQGPAVSRLSVSMPARRQIRGPGARSTRAWMRLRL